MNSPPAEIAHWSPRALLLIVATLALPGCFSERSFPMRSRDVVHVPPIASDASTRVWLEHAHGQLEHLLPRGKTPALLTADLTDENGNPNDVHAHFRNDPDRLPTVWHNLPGLMHTAQAVGPDSSDEPQPPWPGFRDIWIPVGDDLELSARIGFAERDGEIVTSDCIVLLPGLFGDLGIRRTRDIAVALRESGLHVAALETRGFGQTGARYPNVAYTFSILETRDLLNVALWLERQPHVRDTGLIGFCWGANMALVAAWEMTRGTDHLSVRERLQPFMHARLERPVFRAGIIAFSACLRFEEIIESCEQPWPFLKNPVLARLQDGIRLRMETKKHRDVSGSLGDLIRFEFDRTAELAYAESVADSLRYLRLLPYRGKPDGDKLKDVAVPILIVQGANDPLTSAQNVADFFCGLDNPNVAGIVLPGGGHVGFAPYARAYFYSLILNFFDPQ